MGETPISRLEARWVAFLTAIALAFGGIWLQNQYSAVLKIQEDLTEYMKHVDDKYVQKDMLVIFITRLQRIEDKLDHLSKDSEHPTLR